MSGPERSEVRVVELEVRRTSLTFRQLCRESGVHGRTARRMIELGLIEHHESGSAKDGPWPAEAAAALARAERLRQDLSLNLEGAVLAAELLARIEELERRLARRGEASRRPGRF
ncbi:MAG: chaperone modulator CbpM [Miltoncostaeaceae bacterium]